MTCSVERPVTLPPSMGGRGDPQLVCPRIDIAAARRRVRKEVEGKEVADGSVGGMPVLSAATARCAAGSAVLVEDVEDGPTAGGVIKTNWDALETEPPLPPIPAAVPSLLLPL